MRRGATTTAKTAGPTAADMAHRLRARPVIADNVESWDDDNGLVKVVRTVPARGRVGIWVEKRFGLKKTARFDLDAYGSAFWNAIDGKRDLSGIERVLRDQLDVEEARGKEAIIAYTAILMKRNLINLYVKAAPVSAG